ncbi:hypothetical protein [Kingella bonacorsii]|nr:hypothetical protein [Kingella bonacorsii]
MVRNRQPETQKTKQKLKNVYNTPFSFFPFSGCPKRQRQPENGF